MAMHKTRPAIGELIYAWLQEQNINQAELCKRTGFQHSALNQILSGRFRISAERAIILAEVMNTTAEELLILQMDEELAAIRIYRRATQATQAKVAKATSKSNKDKAHA